MHRAATVVTGRLPHHGRRRAAFTDLFKRAVSEFPGLLVRKHNESPSPPLPGDSERRSETPKLQLTMPTKMCAKRKFET